MYVLSWMLLELQERLGNTEAQLFMCVCVCVCGRGEVCQWMRMWLERGCVEVKWIPPRIVMMIDDDPM